MVLILLLLLCNHANLILKLYQKNCYFDEGTLFIGSFKVGSVPEMINKEVRPNLYVNLHNQLKSSSSRKI